MHRAVFLDRDGVINEVLTNRIRFVNKPKDFYLLPGVAQAIKWLNQEGYLVFVVTNQGGIGLGYMSEDMLEAIHQYMKQKLEESGAFVDGIMYCSHKPHEGCPCRKPKAYMLETLAEKHDVNLEQSYMIGDREPDIQAGQKAGCTTILVHARDDQTFGAAKVCADLKTAVSWILDGMKE
ncbi:D-glycero-alpha-D-manno-heptose-1,7-bisphosphate 7-phosphatase [Alkalihalobacillus sp. NPDC078783]